MSGPIHYLSYKVITGSNIAQRTHNMFLHVSEFFDTHPGFLRIASSGSGEESFRVWRAVSSSIPFDVIFKWSYNDIWTFWNINSNYGLGFVVGYHPSGEAWAGTTNNDGNDTKPTSPFKSQSIVYGRPNAAGGDYFNNKNYFVTFTEGSFTYDTGIVCSGDNDSFFFGIDIDNDGDCDGIVCFEKYNPSNNAYNLPFVLLASNDSYDWFIKGQKYGSLTGNTLQGCVSYVYHSGSITQSLPIPERVVFDYHNYYTGPLSISSSFVDKVLEFPILINAIETGAEYVGYMQNARITYGPLQHLSRLFNGTRLALSGGATRPTVTILWNSGTGGSTPNYSSSQCLFMTGSAVVGLAGLAGMPVDRLGVSSFVINKQPDILYRGRIGVNYVYSLNTPPGGASDIVIIHNAFDKEY